MKNLLLALREKTGKHLFLPLLLFLLVFTIDKIVLKLVGIALIYVLHPDFRFRRNIRQIPLFYLLILALELLKFLLLNRDFSQGHTVSFLVGSSFWIVSFLTVYQMRTIVDTVDKEKVNRTLTVFFLINAAISLFNLVLVMYRSHSLNPYLMEATQFGTSTGDQIKGLFMGPSYINMMICAFFIFYFLYREKYALSFLALIVAMLTTSNFGNLIVMPILVVCLIFSKKRKIRLSIAGFLALFLIFYTMVSPSNYRYLRDSLFVPKKKQQELIAYEKKAIILEEKKQAQQMGYSAANVDALLAQQNVKIPDSMLALTGKSGKLQSFKQTAHYLVSGPKAFIFGSGMGCFSSFLAMRMSGVNQEEGSRLFTYLPIYVAPDFRAYHYKLFRAIYSLPREFHSAKHFPNSFLNQLFGEYGFLGALIFLLTYVFFFARHFKKLTYGRYLLFLVGGFLMFDYLFEYLSVIPVFELLMFCDIHRAETAGQSAVSPQAVQS